MAKKNFFKKHWKILIGILILILIGIIVTIVILTNNKGTSNSNSDSINNITGGEISVQTVGDDTYRVHKFGYSDNPMILKIPNIQKSITCNYVIAGGGGGGGGGYVQFISGWSSSLSTAAAITTGGGGGGEVKTDSIQLKPNSLYTISVGKGGDGGSGSISSYKSGGNGTQSKFLNTQDNVIIIANGGYGTNTNRAEPKSSNGFYQYEQMSGTDITYKGGKSGNNKLHGNGYNNVGHFQNNIGGGGGGGSKNKGSHATYIVNTDNFPSVVYATGGNGGNGIILTNEFSHIGAIGGGGGGGGQYKGTGIHGGGVGGGGNGNERGGNSTNYAGGGGGCYIKKKSSTTSVTGGKGGNGIILISYKIN